ncbi:hypothetical protein [Devosia sp. DBB001]|nr:hypothetical protein [Devosia sp. DBB001]
MLNKIRLETVLLGAVFAISLGASGVAAAREPASFSSVRELNPISRANTVQAADLLLASLNHTPDSVDDDIAVAALDSTGIPILPDVSRGKGNGDYNVFGSVVIPVGALPAARAWSHAAGADVVNVFNPDCGPADCGSGLRKVLAKAARDASQLPTDQALNLVNRAVNRNLGYQADRAAWGKGDYWANPSEIARSGVGDCEDFATTKLWLLRSIGFDESQLQLVVLKDTRRQLYHAVLAVHVDGKAYILDNLTNTVTTDTAFISYVPIMSFVGGKNYIHGFQDRRSAVALGNMADVMPGE